MEGKVDSCFLINTRYVSATYGKVLVHACDLAFLLICEVSYIQTLASTLIDCNSAILDGKIVCRTVSASQMIGFPRSHCSSS